MDCATIADRVAAYLDSELSKSELALFEQHLESCEACQALVERVAAVDLSPPPPIPETAEPAYWARMDEALAQEQTRALNTPTPARPTAANRPWSRELRVSLPVVLAYVAFLLLAVGWSFMNLERAQSAEAALQSMEELVQREQRQHQAPPAEVVPESSVRIASSTRGTF